MPRDTLRNFDRRGWYCGCVEGDCEGKGACISKGAPPCHTTEVLVKMPSPVPPRSSTDVRVGALRRRLEGALRALQEVAELDLLQELLEDQRWSGSIREDSIKVLELCETEDGQNRFQKGAAELGTDCRVKLVQKRGGKPSHPDLQ